jgi:hypothetical protein
MSQIVSLSQGTSYLDADPEANSSLRIRGEQSISSNDMVAAANVVAAMRLDGHTDYRSSNPTLDWAPDHAQSSKPSEATATAADRVRTTMDMVLRHSPPDDEFDAEPCVSPAVVQAFQEETGDLRLHQSAILATERESEIKCLEEHSVPDEAETMDFQSVQHTMAELQVMSPPRSKDDRLAGFDVNKGKKLTSMKRSKGSLDSTGSQPRVLRSKKGKVWQCSRTRDFVRRPATSLHCFSKS